METRVTGDGGVILQDGLSDLSAEARQCEGGSETHHPLSFADRLRWVLQGWGWCYVDEAFVELDHPTPQVGPIKRWA